MFLSNGAKDTLANFKLCLAKGIPIMVTAKIKAEIRFAKANSL